MDVLGFSDCYLHDLRAKDMASGSLVVIIFCGPSDILFRVHLFGILRALFDALSATQRT